LSAQFRRLAARKGKKRAIVAVGHTICASCSTCSRINVSVSRDAYNQQPYRDLGADYFDRRNAEQLKRSLVRTLERLGIQVSIVSTAPAPNQLDTYFRGRAVGHGIAQRVDVQHRRSAERDTGGRQPGQLQSAVYRKGLQQHHGERYSGAEHQSGHAQHHQPSITVIGDSRSFYSVR
jgi:hypothetical protein